MESHATLPLDEYNRALVEHVHPPAWQNPQPSGRYNLVVVGAGTAGLVSAAVGAGLRGKVALVERQFMGGDCLVTGCVPSKSVIRAARLVAEARRAEKEIGLALAPGADPDFAAAMRRMRAIRARIGHEDSALRFRGLGVDVYLGDARFVGRDAVEVDGRRLRFARAIIATGARAAAPPIPGLAEAGYLTNETLFDLTARPARLGIIGGGPIGCEMAQAFRRLGSEVVVVHADPHLLPREDADVAALIERRFAEEGIRVLNGAGVRRVAARDGAKRIVFARAGGAEEEIAVDEVLVAVGRAPNVEGLGLEEAGVAVDPSGVRVDDALRTSNPRIYAAGDVCMAAKFTHAADAAAKIAVQNALFSLGPIGRKKLSSLVMPWCTYTDPEVAHVGLSAADAARAGIETDTYDVPLSQVNRATTDGEEEGLVRVHVRRGTDRIVGATVVATHAGEWIGLVTLAMNGGLGLGAIGNTIFPYPTQAEGLKRAAGLYTRSRLTPGVARWFERYLRLRR
ncbi:MAG TPA: mercuric reductase [Myxococcota bacterium]|nr:mercuric reductase [Myxococcota bacterium]